MFGFLNDIPIVGDVVNTVTGHASAKNLQNDAQAHDSHMFHGQVAHDKEMFGLESDFASAMAKKQHQRQRQLLYDSPRLQMEGLKNAGLNPILAATGGFKSPAGGSLPIPSARASSSAKGAGQGSPPGAKLQLGQFRLLSEQANATAKQADLNEAEAAKVRKETEFVGAKTDIAEPFAQLMQAVAGILEQSKIDRETSIRVWRWLASELPEETEPLTEKEQIEMLDKAKRKFPQLKGVDNAKRKIFGDRKK
jgi:hypothetical protein